MKRLLLAVAIMALPTTTLGWGREGHQVVANIAQARLSAAAKQGVVRLLHSATLASVSTYADDYRNTHRETYRWHFVNIPLSAAHYDPARDCVDVPGQGDCVIAEIDRLLVTLRDSGRSEDDRALALRFLVHFVGDLHCPMHSSDNEDKGGNQTQVVFFGRPTNLHSVWDSRLIQQAGYTVASLTDELEYLKDAESASVTLIVWAEEAHNVARDVAYQLPANHELGAAYLDASLPALKHQLLTGGIRLASLLNGLFDRSLPTPAPGTTPAKSADVVAPTPKPTSQGPFHGNAGSHVYHAPACHDYDCKNCTVAFATREEAEKAGYRPHESCVR